MKQKRDLSYGAQLALLLLLLGGGMLLTTFFFLGAMVALHIKISDLNNPAFVNQARLINTLGAVFSFFVPAFALAAIVSRRPFRHLGFRSTISAKQVAVVAGISLASIVLGGALGELNQQIPLSKDLYAKAKALEDSYRAATMAMARMKNLGDYFLALVVMALSPAIVEEVLFRGGFQQVLIGLTRSKWAGIIITSILFSAIHFSFFGFLPRLGLGIVLGLVFAYSRNIWLNIFLHFLNNALIVTQLYVLSLRGQPIEKTMDESMPLWWGLIGLAALLGLFVVLRRESTRVWANEHTEIQASPENIVS